MIFRNRGNSSKMCGDWKDISSNASGLQRYMKGEAGQGSTALSAQALFDIAAQCSDPLLPVSAPVLFDISALDIFDIYFERLTLKIRDFSFWKFGKFRSALRPILLPVLSAQADFSKSLSAHKDPLCQWDRVYWWHRDTPRWRDLVKIQLLKQLVLLMTRYADPVRSPEATGEIRGWGNLSTTQIYASKKIEKLNAFFISTSNSETSLAGA